MWPRRLGWVVCLAWVLGAPACTCKPPINQVDLGFRVAGETQSLDFGRMLENDSATKFIVVSAVTRAAVTVTLQVDPPFSVPASVDIEGGGQVDIPVTFVAPNGPASSEVVLSANGQDVRVPVTGVGVRKPICVPSAPCRTSEYSLEADQCLETVVPDDAACEPTSDCLEQGRCRSGECLGVARRCDDNDQCTNDACAMGLGCVHSKRVCPAPANPCRVPTCDSKTGCGDAPAPDLTPCGPVNCVSLSVCVGGECVTMATPDGVECSAAVACLGEGHCHDQKCQRADAGPWLPEWTAPLPASPVGGPNALLSGGSNGVFFSVCGLATDAGPTDGGELVDAGQGDAGESDGGESDGGASDGGFDAGPPPLAQCALTSYARSGFERFTTPFDDGAPRQLVHVNSAGVVLVADGGLEFRSAVNGSVLHVLPTPRPLPSTRAIAALNDGTVLVALPEDDGGVRVVAWSDAGIEDVAYPGVAVNVLAVTEVEGLLGYDSRSGQLWVHPPRPRRVDAGVSDGGDAGPFDDDGGTDGGVAVVDSVLNLDGGLVSLVTADGYAVTGAQQVLVPLVDGGFQVVSLSWVSDAGQALDFEPRESLLASGLSVTFYRRCPDLLTSCNPEDRPLYLRRVETASSEFTATETQVLPAGPVFLDEAALIGGVFGGVVTFVHGDLDAGTNAGIELLLPGQPPVLCGLPAPVTALRGVLFSGSRLFVLDDRGPAGAVLQSYSLGALPLMSSGWAQPESPFGGIRHAQ